MPCRNICERIGITSMNHYAGVNNYDMGYTYCRGCNRWFTLQKDKDIFCPCCHRKLRHSRRQ